MHTAIKYEDNEGAVKLANNPMAFYMTKHIDIRHLYVSLDLYAPCPHTASAHVWVAHIRPRADSCEVSGVF
jgi:hypothetical protein